MPDSTEEITDMEDTAPAEVQEVPHFRMHGFFLVMPVAAVLYHHELKRVCAKGEVKVVVWFKYLVLLYYVGMIIYAAIV